MVRSGVVFIYLVFFYIHTSLHSGILNISTASSYVHGIYAHSVLCVRKDLNGRITCRRSTTGWNLDQ